MIICRTLATYKGHPLLNAPRSDPYGRDSRIRLPPRVFDAEAVRRPRMEDLLLLVAPCSYPYAIPPRCRVAPALCPGRALRDRIPLGPGPWLHLLRRRHAGFVRRLHSYFGRV